MKPTWKDIFEAVTEDIEDLSASIESELDDLMYRNQFKSSASVPLPLTDEDEQARKKLRQALRDLIKLLDRKNFERVYPVQQVSE